LVGDAIEPDRDQRSDCMKRAPVKEVALAVLLREGFASGTAERLADLIAHEPIPARPAGQANAAERLERALERVKESH
jgi:hypothetical protein